jgi:hypothetical protein
VSRLTTSYRAHVFEDVCAAVERCTTVRKRLGPKLVADCPVCRRRKRLEVTDAPDRVLIHCHAGCNPEAILGKLGLDWPAFFKERRVRVEPTHRSAEGYVLHAIRRDRRWSLVTHRNDFDRESALAITVVEHVLPARHEVRRLLRTRDREPIPWDEFPFTAAFIQKALAKLGITIGLKYAYRVQRAITGTPDHPGLLDFSSFFKPKDGKDSPGYAIWKFSIRARFQASKALLVQEPAKTTLLSAGSGLSRVISNPLARPGELLRPKTTTTRPPPEATATPTIARTPGTPIEGTIRTGASLTPGTTAIETTPTTAATDERAWCPVCGEGKRTIRKAVYPGLVWLVCGHRPAVFPTRDSR